MTELLDDLYHLEHQHNQHAYNGLIELPAIQEKLLWTALPISKKNPKDILWALLGAPCCIMIGLLLAGAIRLSVLYLIVIFLILIGFGVLGLVIAERDRKRIFYGISASSIWIKKYQMPLKQYHISSLTRLAVDKNTLSYSIINDQSYSKHILLEEVPDIQPVYQLLLQLQEEQQQTN
ncbi:MAG: hypothetical protein ACRBFS_00335 [Aureispira sp.]